MSESDERILTEEVGKKKLTLYLSDLELREPNLCFPGGVYMLAIHLPKPPTSPVGAFLKNARLFRQNFGRYVNMEVQGMPLSEYLTKFVVNYIEK